MKRPAKQDGATPMAKSIKSVVEADIPGWTLDDTAETTAQVADAAPARESDFVGKDMASVREKYGLTTDASVTAEAAGEAKLVRIKSKNTRDDGPLGTRSALVVGNKVIAVQG